MNQNRLFNVLVVGGLAALGATPTFGDSFPSGFEVDHGSVQIEQNLNNEAEPPQPVFCDTEEAKKEFCTKGPCGVPHPKKGFTCCWGTSCYE